MTVELLAADPEIDYDRVARYVDGLVENARGYGGSVILPVLAALGQVSRERAHAHAGFLPSDGGIASMGGVRALNLAETMLVRRADRLSGPGPGLAWW